MGSGANRNKPCPCGSGKKSKICCDGRLPVLQTVTVDFGEPTIVNGYSFSRSGELQLLRDGKPLTARKAWTGSHRAKQNGGEKQLVRVPIPPESLRIGEMASLKRYDRIFAIDTNTKATCNTVVSVSCFAECRFIRKGGEDAFEYAVLGAFDFQDGPVPKCENFGWHVLIEAIHTSPDYDDKKQFAIITDSDLGQHSAYNDGMEPYFADHLLPRNFELLYATDKGRDPSCQVIRLCDREATQIRQRIEDGEISPRGGILMTDGWCSSFRGWINNNAEFSKAGWFRIGQLPLGALASTEDD